MVVVLGGLGLASGDHSIAVASEAREAHFDYSVEEGRIHTHLVDRVGSCTRDDHMLHLGDLAVVDS